MIQFLNGFRLFFDPFLAKKLFFTPDEGDFTRHFQAPAYYLNNALNVEEKKCSKQQEKKSKK